VSHRSVVERWFEEVWNQNNPAAIDDVLAEPCEILGLAENPIRNRDEMKAFHAAMNASLDQINITIDEMIECGDQVAVIFCVSGNHRATGSPVSMNCASIAWVENEMLKRAKNVNDFLTMFVQAGVVPKNAVEMGLSTTDIRK